MDNEDTLYERDKFMNEYAIRLIDVIIDLQQKLDAKENSDG